MAINTEKIRTAVNNNAAVVSIAAIVVVLALGAFILKQLGVFWVTNPGTEMSSKAFFLDEDALDPQNPEVRPVTDLPPLPGKNGKLTLVRAVYYTYGSDAEKKLAYLEKYSQAYKEVQEKIKRQEQITQADSIEIGNGLGVRSPEAGSTWWGATTPQGRQVMSRLGAEGAENHKPQDMRKVYP